MLSYDALIDCIYAASLDPDLWPVALARISDYLEATKSRLSTPFLPVEHGGLTFSVGFDVDTDAIYRARHYDRDDLWTQRMVERGLARAGSVALDSDLATDAEIRATRFFRELLAPLNATRLCRGVVFDDADPSLPTTACSLFRGERDPRFGAVERERMAAVTRHLSRALGVTFRLRDAELGVAAAHGALDGLDHGTALLDAEGGVVFANRAADAILRAKRGLELAGRAGGSRARLTASEPASAESLRRGIEALTMRDRTLPSHFIDSVLIEGSAGHAPLLVQLAPLGDNRSSRGLPRDAVAIAFVIDAERTPMLDPGVLRQIYQFTVAEARVAQALVTRGGIARVAAATNVAESTIRSHLKSMFAKTGATSQGDLIRMLMLAASGTAGRKPKASP